MSRVLPKDVLKIVSYYLPFSLLRKFPPEFIIHRVAKILNRDYIACEKDFSKFQQSIENWYRMIMWEEKEIPIPGAESVLNVSNSCFFV